MTIEEVHDRIKQLLFERDWTLYKLADICSLPYSTLYTMMNRHTMPKLDTLDIICKGLGITLSDFFITKSTPCPNGYLSEKELLLIEITHSLPEQQVELISAYAKGISDSYQLTSSPHMNKPE